MRKRYVLDANVLLHDPTSLTHFVDNTVIIPIEVISEIDRFKRESTARGQNARHVSRLLDQLRNGQSLAAGVELPNGVFLQVHYDSASDLAGSPGDADARLLEIARQLREQDPAVPVIIVSKDINLRIRADAMGLRAEDYETDRVVLSDVYRGHTETTLPPDQVEALGRQGQIPWPAGSEFVSNQYVLVRAEGDVRATLLARARGADRTLRVLDAYKDGICGIRPRNKEQYYAADALLDDEVRLVTLMGKAGTGKTLLAIAAALHKVLVEKKYRGISVARPTVSVGKEIGFLPGDVGQKLAPWMAPVTDTFEFLFDMDRTFGGHDKFEKLMSAGVIEIQALSLIRGRSINRRFIIVDEAQNLSPLEVKTIVTRAGHGSKIVLTGDPDQIDNPYVDAGSNGFNFLVERFRGQDISAHVELTRGERSHLAELAANLL